MPTVVNDAARLYQRIAALLEKHSVSPALKADVDAVFHAPEEPAAAAAPSGFDPTTWGAVSGVPFAHDFTDASPVSFHTTIAITGVKLSMGCGAGSFSDATPVITDAAGNVLANGYGAHFEVQEPTPVTVTVTPNTVPTRVSIALMRG